MTPTNEEKHSAAARSEVGESELSMAAVRLTAVMLGSSLDLHLAAFARKLYRAKWILLSCIVAGAALALMLGALQTPLYVVRTTIEIQNPLARSQPIIEPSKTNPPDSSENPQESYIKTQLRIIESRSLVERALSKLTDTERSRILEPQPFWWRRTSYDQVLEGIRRHVAATQASQPAIVDITFSSPDSAAGSHFLNSLTQELNDFNFERTWRSVQRNRQWTQRQIDDLRRKWEDSEALFSEYSQSLSHKQTVPKLTKSSKPARLQAAALLASQEVNDEKLRQLRTKLTDISKQIAQWQALYGATGSPVQKLRAEAANTETAIRQRRAVLQKNATSLAGSYVATVAPSQTTTGAPPAGTAQSIAHLSALRQEADSNRQLFESTSTRLREASIAYASQIGDISVVDPAIPVTDSTAPSQFLTALLGAFAGLAFGVGFVAFKDQLSRTFSEPAPLANYLGLQVLGAIPADRLALRSEAYDAAKQEPNLRLNFAPDAATAEAYRTIRSSILHKAAQRSGPRRLLFTSAGSGEGKTSVVANLGAALASAQRRVLLVDGNLRHPGLHKLFGADNTHGMADLLTRQLSDNPVSSRDVILETQIPDLYLLTAGQAGERAPEVLSSTQLPELIRTFAKGFDLVLIDSPPLLPYSDARSLVPATDAVILIVRAGATVRHAALQAREAITRDGSPIIGTILTEWDATNAASA